MWEKVIVHADLNQCYAQIEEMIYPELKKVPMAIGENKKSDQGVILAVNDLAFEYGIKQGDSLKNAYHKCPNLLIVQPHYDDYHYYVEEVKNIYREYTDHIESLGLNEAWLDLTASQRLFGGDPISIAKEIQMRIYQETGFVVSMGVSFNKAFAKLGNHFDNEKGLMVISKKNFKNIVFPLSVDMLLDVSKTVINQLKENHIYTIGDIAHCHKEHLSSFLGQNGERLWYFANGMDEGENAILDLEDKVKSVGNRMTTQRNLSTYEDIRKVLAVLVKSVSSRLKEKELKGSIISLQMRDHELHSYMWQKEVTIATNSSTEIMKAVEALLQANYLDHDHKSLNHSYCSVSVIVSQLTDDIRADQLDFYTDKNQRQKSKGMDMMIDYIKNAFDKMKPSYLNVHQELVGYHSKKKHIIRPEG